MRVSIKTIPCVLVTFLLSFFFFLVSSITVSYDTSYDDASRNLDTIACSDGTNGLLTKNYATQGSLPSFPRIGGASVITGWNSESCGTCWTLTYNHTSINVLAIDHASQGFNIAKAAMDSLTGGHATAFGRVDANYTQAEPSDCRM
ncbi:Protein SnodProt1 [Golovinomyces cichoracearum]|uniref:Protein SnodProt1 n=1 Tax=Golovinomyces cichoracearum TaxID=62708 RepID=A0A420IU75_9PEZI|nr:Protein SnodProt1 [Golovinomyces cichoracearum]